jgi:hypothetical protein
MGIWQVPIGYHKKKKLKIKKIDQFLHITTLFTNVTKIEPTLAMSCMSPYSNNMYYLTHKRSSRIELSSNDSHDNLASYKIHATSSNKCTRKHN